MWAMAEAYLDIETTGLSADFHDMTVVGVSVVGEGGTRFVQLVGEDITEEGLLEVLDGVSTIYTYNGQRFDLPFIRALVRMEDEYMAQVTPQQVREQGLTDCYQPVADFTAPTLKQINRMIRFIEDSVANAKPVGVSCHAGIGRTGTILACYLVRKGRTAEEAMQEVALKRRAGIATDDQKQAVRDYAGRMGR
jgi:atypical dual specificity phosphatase